MSIIEGATPEPPCHYECALFSVRNCPHLSTSASVFSAKYDDAAGYAPQANISKVRSDATAIWMTKGRIPAPFRAGHGILFELQGPERLEWYVGGSPASVGEVRQALDAVLPTLRRTAEREGRGEELVRRLLWLERWLPI